MTSTPSVYGQLQAAGVPLDSHESDLYVRVTPVSTGILRASTMGYTVFVDRRTGALWYDVPFAFDPWWEARVGRRGR
jgi:hypothetical protein